MPFNLDIGYQSSEGYVEEFSSCADDHFDDGTHVQTEQHGEPPAYIVFPSSTPVPLSDLPVAGEIAIRIANLQVSRPSNPHDISTDMTFDAWGMGEHESFDAWDMDAEEGFPNAVQQYRLPVAAAAA